MNDRLVELGRTHSLKQEDDHEDLESGEMTALSADKKDAPAEKKNKDMEFFFEQVDGAKADISAIALATSTIGELNEEAILATTTKREEEISNNLRPLVQATNKRAKLVKRRLELLKEDNNKHTEEKTLLPSQIRIRTNLCTTLTRKFIDEMKAYQNAQQKYKADVKKKVKRQVHIVKPDATDDEIDAAMKSGGKDALLKGQILAGGVNDSIKDAYQNASGKYQDVLAIESSIAELNQMFLDFALLTSQQGEILDQIEYNVKNAADYVEDANIEVVEAGKIKDKMRKKQVAIAAFVALGILFLLKKVTG